MMLLLIIYPKKMRRVSLLLEIFFHTHKLRSACNCFEAKIKNEKKPMKIKRCFYLSTHELGLHIFVNHRTAGELMMVKWNFTSTTNDFVHITPNADDSEFYRRMDAVMLHQVWYVYSARIPTSTRLNRITDGDLRHRNSDSAINMETSL